MKSTIEKFDEGFEYARAVKRFVFKFDQYVCFSET